MNKRKHNRVSIRLRGFDYASAGAYFITICTRNRTCLFGDVVDGNMRLNVFGRFVYTQWVDSSRIRKEIMMDAFIVMPNHIHGIVWIVDTDSHVNDVFGTTVGATGRSPLRYNDPDPRSNGPRQRHNGPHPQINGPHPQINDPHPQCNGPRHHPNGPAPRSISSFVAGFKSACTKQINQTRNTPGMAVWQRGYYEHIIRNEGDLIRIRNYILNNPRQWWMDR
ncbi:transposase [bacterium]|nr:transposase [bacterium]